MFIVLFLLLNLLRAHAVGVNDEKECPKNCETYTTRKNDQGGCEMVLCTQKDARFQLMSGCPAIGFCSKFGEGEAPTLEGQGTAPPSPTREPVAEPETSAPKPEIKREVPADIMEQGYTFKGNLFCRNLQGEGTWMFDGDAAVFDWAVKAGSVECTATINYMVDNFRMQTDENGTKAMFGLKMNRDKENMMSECFNNAQLVMDSYQGVIAVNRAGDLKYIMDLCGDDTYFTKQGEMPKPPPTPKPTPAPVEKPKPATPKPEPKGCDGLDKSKCKKQDGCDWFNKDDACKKVSGPKPTGEPTGCGSNKKKACAELEAKKECMWDKEKDMCVDYKEMPKGCGNEAKKFKADKVSKKEKTEFKTSDPCECETQCNVPADHKMWVVDMKKKTCTCLGKSKDVKIKVAKFKKAKAGKGKYFSSISKKGTF